MLPQQPLKNRVMCFLKKWVSEESLLECLEQSFEKMISGTILDPKPDKINAKTNASIDVKNILKNEATKGIPKAGANSGDSFFGVFLFDKVPQGYIFGSRFGFQIY